MARLNIEWPAGKERQERPKSKLDECFVCLKSPPPRRGLHFFPDLHTEVSRSWNKPYSVRLFSPEVSQYSNVMGMNECGYGKICRVEDKLVSYLSPGGASSLKISPSRSPEMERCHLCPCSKRNTGRGAALQVKVFYRGDRSEDGKFQ